MIEKSTSVKTLNHFSSFRFTPDFWAQEASVRGQFFHQWEADLQSTGACVYFYQLTPLSTAADGLLWCALPAEQKEDAARFFDRFARSLSARRTSIALVETLWGFTKPSQYSRGNSAQEIDPLQPKRQPYLVAYPFVKTAEWYLLSRDTRQGMMNQHIRIGHQYPEIQQLLLYSFGLQDQEFVVVYEMDDLNRFSELVNELRSSEARRYTLRDTPVSTAVWHSAEEMGAIFAGDQEAA